MHDLAISSIIRKKYNKQFVDAYEWQFRYVSVRNVYHLELWDFDVNFDLFTLTMNKETICHCYSFYSSVVRSTNLKMQH